MALRGRRHWLAIDGLGGPSYKTSDCDRLRYTYHDLPRDASFWLFLLSIDQDLAESARKKPCPCGGRLHCANYPRKPRGGPDDLPEQYRYRLSFCCDREGCRKRVTRPGLIR